MKLKFFIIFAILIFTNLIATAQNNRPEPVKWTFSAEKTGDKTYNLVFEASIEDKWHVYSQFLKEGGPVATSITFDNASEFIPQGVTEESGEKHEGHDKLFDMEIVDFSHTMKLVQRIELTQNVGEIMGYVTFMTCNGETCLPPTDIPFIIQLN